MRYKAEFIAGDLHLVINTNSRRLYNLTHNVLDLNNARATKKPGIKIKYFINEESLKDLPNEKKVINEFKRIKHNSYLTFFGSRQVDVSIDSKNAIVRAAVYHYSDSIKEVIAHLTLINPLQLILPSRGFFFLHASAVSRGSDYVLINGPQNCGKTTLAIVLAHNNFSLLTDDDCFIKLKRNRVQLLPFPTKLGLKNRIIKAYPDLKKYLLKNYLYGKKRRISIKSIPAFSAGEKNCACKIIIFPKYIKKARKLRVKELSKNEAITRLSRESALIHNPSEKEFRMLFWALHALTKEARCLELGYSTQLNDIPVLINKLLQS